MSISAGRAGLGWAGRASPPAEYSKVTRPLTLRRAPGQYDNTPSTEVTSEGHPPPPADHTSSSDEIRIHLHQSEAGQTRQEIGSQRQPNVRDSERSGSSNLQLQLSQTELEFEERERNSVHMSENVTDNLSCGMT